MIEGARAVYNRGMPLGPARSYAAERAWVTFMLGAVERLLAGASVADAVVRDEVRGFPEGYRVGLSVLGAPSARLRLVARGGRLAPDASPARPDLEITFKHVSHAFLVLTFQEGTAQAFANDRAFTSGDIACAMRLVRCLARMEAVALPRLLAQRALKEVPDLPLRTRAPLALRTYAAALLAMGER